MHFAPRVPPRRDDRRRRCLPSGRRDPRHDLPCRAAGKIQIDRRLGDLDRAATLIERHPEELRDHIETATASRAASACRDFPLRDPVRARRCPFRAACRCRSPGVERAARRCHRWHDAERFGAAALTNVTPNLSRVCGRRRQPESTRDASRQHVPPRARRCRSSIGRRATAGPRFRERRDGSNSGLVAVRGADRR